MKDWKERFGPIEWAWIERLGRALHDAEQKRDFWDTIRAKKDADENYSIFSDFPRTNAAALAQKYAPLCIDALKGKK